MTYTFTFDASACSGCKACQIACKDKNNLPVGVLWRRVYEVSGGTWTNVGARSSRPDMGTNPGTGEPRPYAVWENDVFAYNLSIACNHCVHPKCAGVCPTDAYIQREDGIVYIDESKCMGCGYCNWACPYGVPQYNPVLGYMTKCNFCLDNLDEGLPPACVAACPMRVLDFAQVSSESESLDGKKLLWEIPAAEHPFPLPEHSRTEPHMAIKHHAGMLNSLEKVVSNREETKPAKSKNELPLVIFTLLGQMAVGIAVYSLFAGPLSLPILITLGGLIGIGGFVSVLHLGTPLNAWRAPFHLRKSWLSREILFFGLFGASWLISLIMPGMGKLPLASTGVGFLYSMAQVYRLRSIRAWDSWRTNASFFITALLLGRLVTLLVLEGEGGWSSMLLFGASLTVQVLSTEKVHERASRLRLGLTAVGIAISAIPLLTSSTFSLWLILFMLALTEETIGRWLFYEHLNQRRL